MPLQLAKSVQYALGSIEFPTLSSEIIRSYIMKNIALFLCCLFVSPVIAQMYSTTYTAGNISGPSGYTTATPTSCPGTLVINNIPNGRVIDSVVMTYTFFTTLAGFQSVINQRSYVACPTFSTTETQLTQPGNTGPGTQVVYNRRVTIADGLTVNGPLTFIMYAGSADPLAFASCTNAQNVIMNNTWVVNVYTSNPASSCQTPTALQTSRVRFDSAYLAWTQATPTINQWEVAFGPTADPFSSFQRSIRTSPSFAIGNLVQASPYTALVRAICGSGDTSNWSAPVNFTTDTMPCLAPDSSWWFRRGNATATIYWSPTHPQSAVNFEYGTAGYTRGTGTLTNNLYVDSIRVFNLQAIAYHYYYQVNCFLRTTAWEGPFTFNMSTVSVAEANKLVNRIYPQPATDYLQLELAQPVNYQLRNLLGQSLRQGQLEAGTTQIDVRDLSPGLYLLQLQHGGREQLLKVVVDR